MKYPYILFFRYDKYSYIDEFINANKAKFLCSIFIVDKKEELNKMFDPNYHLLITFGEDETIYHKDVHDIILNKMTRRWLHYEKLDENNIDDFNRGVNYCYLHI